MTMAIEPADDEEFGNVFSSEREDRGGKDPAAVEAPEQTPAPRDEGRDELGRFAAKSTEQPPLAEEQPPPDANASRHVPLPELLSERKLRQEKERLLTEAEARVKAYEQVLQAQQAQRPAVQPQPQQPMPEPDPYAEPEAYVQFHLQRQAAEQREATLFVYEDAVRDKHGDQSVNAALHAAVQTGVINQLKEMRNPWKELMKWHKDHAQRSEIGDDLEAFKKRVADEAVAKALGTLKSGGAVGQPQQRFPGTLATATATGTQGAALTDEAVMGEVFGSSRRNRR